MPISDYPRDRTQGPRASLSVIESLATRDLWFAGLADPNKHVFESNFDYTNGYINLGPSNSGKSRTLSSSDISRIGILTQDGFERHTGQLVTQVFNSAPAYPRHGTPDEASYEAYLSRKLIVAAYESTAKIAAVKKAVTKQDTPLHLTLVGGGSFNNPFSAVLDGVMSAISIAERNDLHVYVHVYSLQNETDRRVHDLLSSLYGDVIGCDDFF